MSVKKKKETLVVPSRDTRGRTDLKKVPRIYWKKATKRGDLAQGKEWHEKI